VDDDESVRCALGVLLVTYGFKVDTFSSAKEFFALCPIALPVISSWISICGLDGWEALKRINNPDTGARSLLSQRTKAA